MVDVLFLFMRWLHIVSMTTLVGGLLFARLVLMPSAGAMAADAQKALWERAAAAYRPWVLAAMAGLLVSGTFNLLTTPGHSRFYHMLIGIKVLLALHVFAAASLITRPNNPKRARQITATVISALIILGISAWLRRIF